MTCPDTPKWERDRKATAKGAKQVWRAPMSRLPLMSTENPVTVPLPQQAARPVSSVRGKWEEKRVTVSNGPCQQKTW